jgi:formamidopyrimidine-DNA glycosylase
VPELPEVEVVRRGLARWVRGSVITGVEVLHPRPVRSHPAGPRGFAAALAGGRVRDAVRRGKFLWLELDDAPPGTQALTVHLGMSGQLLLQPPDAPAERHLRVRFSLRGGPAERAGRELRFVDQRMFGGLTLSDLVPTPDGLPAGAAGLGGGPSGAHLPPQVAPIARDVLDPHLDEDALLRRLRTRSSGIKRALLDQRLISGIGNIYADEALWRCRLHAERDCASIPARTLRRLLAQARETMIEALAAGGTSFDALYVNVNGDSGYFERDLAVYGRQGQPCTRCGRAIVREPFANRSSFRCPRCQPVRAARHGTPRQRSG